MATPVKVKALVSNVTKFSKDVVMYDFKPQGRVPLFKSGQFLHLSVEEYDGIGEWPESRVFSIASSPKNKDEKIKIIVSAKGKYTSKIVSVLKQNDIVWLKLPYGEFQIKDNDKPIVLVAGGTGISPFIPFMEQRLLQPASNKVVLYYGIKNEDLIICNELLDKCSSAENNFSTHLYLENEPKNFREASTGILDKEKIFQDNKFHADYYLSGPIEMINNFKDYFIAMGVSENNIFIDNWN